MATMPVKLIVTGSRNCNLFDHIPPFSPTLLPLSSTFIVSVPLPVMLMMPWTYASTLPVFGALPVTGSSAPIGPAFVPMSISFVPEPVLRFSVVTDALPWI